MAADVVETANDTVFAADDDKGISVDLESKVIPRLRNFATMSGKKPATPPDPIKVGAINILSGVKLTRQRTPRLALAVVTADCVPVLMADARAGVIAAVHAGRVGAQQGIVASALQTMMEVGARVEDVSVLLGPAVSGRNYEVPAEMAAEVERALPGSRTTTRRGTPGLDLRAGIAAQLRALGVAAIDVDPRCTVEDRNLFSHRRDSPTGRLASLVWLEPV